MSKPITLKNLELYVNTDNCVKAQVSSQWMKEPREKSEIWVEICFIKLDVETQTCWFNTKQHGRSIVLPWDCKVAVLDDRVLAKPRFGYGIPQRVQGISID